MENLPISRDSFMPVQDLLNLNSLKLKCHLIDIILLCWYNIAS